VCVSAGVISGALLYIRDDFKAVDRKTWLQVTSIFSETIDARIQNSCELKPTFMDFNALPYMLSVHSLQLAEKTNLSFSVFQILTQITSYNYNQHI